MPPTVVVSRGSPRTCDTLCLYALICNTFSLSSCLCIGRALGLSFLYLVSSPWEFYWEECYRGGNLGLNGGVKGFWRNLF